MLDCFCQGATKVRIAKHRVDPQRIRIAKRIRTRIRSRAKPLYCQGLDRFAQWESATGAVFTSILFSVTFRCGNRSLFRHRLIL